MLRDDTDVCVFQSPQYFYSITKAKPLSFGLEVPGNWLNSPICLEYCHSPQPKLTEGVEVTVTNL